VSGILGTETTLHPKQCKIFAYFLRESVVKIPLNNLENVYLFLDLFTFKMLFPV